MWLFRLVLVALSTIAIKAEKAVDYDGYVLFHANPESQDQIDAILKLEKEDKELDFWAIPKILNNPATVLVPPSSIDSFKSFAKRNEIKLETSDLNIAEIVKEQQSVSLRQSGMSWTTYHQLKDIDEWLYSLEKTYPGVVKTSRFGYSFEGRNMTGVKISYGEGRKAVFIEGGIHAREWISPATVTYIINELLSSNNSDVRKIATSFDWYILPVTNPDGYTFTFNRNRLWRKTRKNYNGYCYGTDGNRNWDFHWGEVGTSDDQCDQTYGGPQPFSESETYTLSEFLRTIGPDLKAYISFHSYSQLLLIPYAYTKEHMENYDDLRLIGDKMVTSLAKRYGTEYKAGTPGEVIYSASGSSMDWAKKTFNIPIVYTYELRDKGRYGFLLPANQIIPNSEEVMDSLITMFVEAEKLNYVKLV